ncbi:hypothetical protein [Candidatus Nanohalovita haloferacivicina]|uniref:hypothetical protein n=1 Tax=Candidatus Nanohalovita haloferacivicina TaxID=2978046 RepID=UPI00325FAC1A|nr:hypothetical protein HBNXNv_0745 [Candidatus Nanohalobia archaeon BNXNv]
MARALISGALVLVIFSGLILASAGNEEAQTDPMLENNDSNIQNVYWSFDDQKDNFSGPLVVRNLSQGEHNVTITVVFSDGKIETYNTRVNLSR